jgi:hypothetical protein
LIGAVSPLHLDVNGHVGPNNVKRLEAVCLGVIQGSTHYKLEDRKEEATVTTEAPAAETSATCEGGTCAISH